MQDRTISLPATGLRKAHIVKSMSCYWQKNADKITSLPVQEIENVAIKIPLKLVEIDLPPWAEQYGINGTLLVPEEACSLNEQNNWQKTDWWLAAFLLLESWHERLYEHSQGSIHSYSFRLKGWDSRAWDYAWVNRIALFLRCWASQVEKQDENMLFGEISSSHITMTHDVDAVSKTLPIRIKQFVFNSFNAVRAIKRGQFGKALARLKQALIFLFSNKNWWKLDEVLQLEERAGIKSQFNFHADPRSKTFKRWLFDPGYNIKNEQLLFFIANAKKSGHTIGLHPGYDAWQSEELISQQLQLLCQSVGSKVTTCRQHWLRFAWNDTWLVQQKAGIELDTTIMFNDRPGFRVSAAIVYQPWNPTNNSTHNIRQMPTILMDSHFYDYSTMEDHKRNNQMESYMNEIKLVHGKAAVLWHPHTLTSDYGWKAGFINLLKLIKS